MVLIGEGFAPMSRITVALLSVAALALTGAPAAGAKPKSKCAKSHAAKAGTRCKKPTKKPTPFALPVKVTVLDGSAATLTLADTPPRVVPLTGGFVAEIPGGYQLGRDNTIVLKSGGLHVGVSDLLTDDCAEPPVARTDPASTVLLAPGTKSTALVRKDGTVTAAATTIMRVVLDIRNGPCGSAPVATGYADTPLKAVLTGTIGAGGLQRLQLDAPAMPVTASACLTPGPVTSRCAGAPVTYPVTVSVHLVVGVAIG
jgi:hypothetical protein